MNILLSFLCGLIFALGLTISGMINPAKVIGFLDITGNWDYSLAFVMGGAVILNLITFKLIGKRKAPLFADQFHWPTKKDIDWKLIIGAACFGVGWGMIGICPGPGIVNIVSLTSEVFTFLLAMMAGMFLYKVIR